MTLNEWFEENPDWGPYADMVVKPPTDREIFKEFPDASPELLVRCMEVVSEAGLGITRGTVYIRVRREDKGKGMDKWGAMLALQAPPGINTTDTFWAGRKSWVDVFGEDYANRVKKGLAAKGVNIGPKDEYMPELVRPGYGPKNPDPEAVVKFHGARSYIKKLCERRGWACEGSVTVKHRQPEEDPHTQTPMAMNLIRKYASEMVRKNPALKKVSKKELAQQVIAKHGPSR